MRQSEHDGVWCIILFVISEENGVPVPHLWENRSLCKLEYNLKPKKHLLREKSEQSDRDDLPGEPGEPPGVGGDGSAEVGGAALLHLRQPGGRGEPGLQDRQQDGGLPVGDETGQCCHE